MDRMEELIRITWSAAGTLFLFGFISAWYAHNMMWFGINGVGTLITLTAAFSWERRYQRPIPLAAGTPQKEESCCICLDPLVGDIAALPCLHAYHRPCITRWFQEKYTCPLCNQWV